MNPATSIPPAPAAPPAALARASGGLTRRRKVVVAIEIALIAAILAFAGVRPLGQGFTITRLRAIADRMAARFEPGAEMEACDRVVSSMRSEYQGLVSKGSHRTGPAGRTLFFSHEGPFVRHGLARAMLGAGRVPDPARNWYFFMYLVPDTAGRLDRVVSWVAGRPEWGPNDPPDPDLDERGYFHIRTSAPN